MKAVLLAFISLSAMANPVFKDGFYNVKQVNLNHPQVKGVCKYENIDFFEENIRFARGKLESNYSLGVFPQILPDARKDCSVKLFTERLNDKKVSYLQIDSQLQDLVLMTKLENDSVKLEIAAGKFKSAENIQDYRFLEERGYTQIGVHSIFGMETYYFVKPNLSFSGKSSLVLRGDCRSVEKTSASKMKKIYDYFLGEDLIQCDLQDNSGHVILKRE
jgi:hypothetical protein